MEYKASCMNKEGINLQQNMKIEKSYNVMIF